MQRFILTLCLISFTLLLKGQSFETIMNKTYVLLTIAQERDRQAAERLDETKTRRIRVEEDLVDLKERGISNALQKKEVDKLDKQSKSLKSQEKDIAKLRKEAADFLSDVTDIIKATDKNRAKFIADYEKRNGKIPDVKLPDNQEVTSVPVESQAKSTDKIAQLEQAASMPREDFSIDNKGSEGKSESNKSKKKKEKKESKDKKKTNMPIVEENSNTEDDMANAAKFKVYETKDDVNLNPPIPECKIVFDGTDNFTGKKKKETASIVLFKHTEDFMRPLMKERDYITCEVSMSRVHGGFYFMNMIFTILTKEGQKSFGFLDRNTPIIFKFINGANVTLLNAKTDIGTFDTEKGTSIYKIQIQMDSGNAKALGSAELDTIRVAWSAGYEDYEIYDMDALIHLFKCLDRDTK
jgi:hypothetical protein